MADTVSIRKIIEKHNENLAGWYLSGDIDAAAQVFAEDCWQMPPNTEPLVGRSAYRAFWKQAVQWGDWRFTLETQDLLVSGDIAVERGKYILNFQAGPTAPPGLISNEDRGNYVVMWRLDPDGEWRVVWDAPVSTVPPGSA
jgi:ketosteroid isomerase-like protein